MTQESEEAAEQDPARCSFCQKSEADTGRLVEGPKREGDAPVYICADCVELCSAILEHEKQRAQAGGEEANGSSDNSAILRQRIDELGKTLSDRESGIIELRYGLSDGYSRTLEEVGALLDIAPEEVRRIEAEVIAKLQADRESL